MQREVFLLEAQCVVSVAHLEPLLQIGREMTAARGDAQLPFGVVQHAAAQRVDALGHSHALMAFADQVQAQLFAKERLILGEHLRPRLIHRHCAAGELILFEAAQAVEPGIQLGAFGAELAVVIIHIARKTRFAQIGHVDDQLQRKHRQEAAEALRHRRFGLRKGTARAFPQSLFIQTGVADRARLSGGKPHDDASLRQPRGSKLVDEL